MLFTGEKLNSPVTGQVRMDNRLVTFPDWKQALANAGFPAAAAAAYPREIITFLKHCKTQHVPATVPLAKQYVENQERLRSGPVRVALRWCFQAAKAGNHRAMKSDRRGRPTCERSRIFSDTPTFAPRKSTCIA